MGWQAESLKYVGEFTDFETAMTVGDEVDRIYGFRVTVITIGGSQQKTQGTLYIDGTRPAADAAWDYARELVVAMATGGWHSYDRHVRTFARDASYWRRHGPSK